MSLRGIRHVPLSAAPGATFDAVTLEAHERHLRRKLLVTEGGHEVLVDLGLPAWFEDGDHLELEDGRFIAIRAAVEDLYEVRGENPRHIVSLAWHLGNRHLAAQAEQDRILIRRDPVIRDMLVKLHARVTDVREQFNPVQGAYRSHAH